MWEDKTNINGGCFSFKIVNKNIEKVWKDIFFRIIGGTITKNTQVYNNIYDYCFTIMTFCILKIWMKTCEFQDPDIFVDIIVFKIWLSI